VETISRKLAAVANRNTCTRKTVFNDAGQIKHRKLNIKHPIYRTLLRSPPREQYLSLIPIVSFKELIAAGPRGYVHSTLLPLPKPWLRYANSMAGGQSSYNRNRNR